MSPKLKELTAKENAATEYYVDPVSETRNNWCKSYLRAGYSHCKGWKTNALRILAKDYIKAAIGAKRQIIGEKISVSREYLIEKLQNIIEDSTSENNQIKAMALAGEFLGFKRELAPNEEKEAKRLARMSLETKRMAEIKADKRLSQVAEGDRVIESVLDGDSGVVRANDGI